jgi:DmsE family decaheme c-type cytochrome
MKTLLTYLLISAAIVFGANAAEQALSSRPDLETLKKGLHALQAKASNALASPMISFHGKRISTDTCAACHEDETSSFKNTTHAHSWKATTACEQCHGDATKHLEAGGAAGTIVSMRGKSANEVSATCMNCHEKVGEQAHGKLSEHYRAGVACITCHDVHPSDEHKLAMNTVGKSAMLKGKQTELCLSCHNTQSAEFNMPAHHRVKEGVVECSSCHNPHGTTFEHQLRADTKTLCVTCHQDKRGPFVFEHNAQALDGCMACHESHGSGARNLLKDRDPRTLCVSCHSKETGVGVPHSRGNFSLQTSGDCTRCHATIHGSNRSEFFIN